jgi:hypothetical protein
MTAVCGHSGRMSIWQNVKIYAQNSTYGFAVDLCMLDLAIVARRWHTGARRIPHGTPARRPTFSHW